MESIGLFEAKTHLSDLVARAERGEEVIITRHNKPVAKLVPYEAVVAFDVEQRRQAIEALLAVRKDLRRRHGSVSREEIVSWIHEAREERDEQILRAAGMRKP